MLTIYDLQCVETNWTFSGLVQFPTNPHSCGSYCRLAVSTAGWTQRRLVSVWLLLPIKEVSGLIISSPVSLHPCTCLPLIGKGGTWDSRLSCKKMRHFCGSITTIKSLIEAHLISTSNVTCNWLRLYTQYMQY